MLLKVRRQNKFSRDSAGKRDVWFLFGGRRFELGETFDAREFDAHPDKWDSLVNLGYLDRVDDDGMVTNRLVRERPQRRPSRAATEADEDMTATQPPVTCEHCDYVAKNAHGIKVHVGRRHKELT